MRASTTTPGKSWPARSDKVSTPELHPLHGLRARACLDWLELVVELPAPSQFRHVQARAPAHWGKTFIDPLDGEASSRKFRLRVQNPGPPSQVLWELQSLSASGPIPAENLAVTGLEIAVDFIPETSEQGLHLAQVAAYLNEHLAKPPAGPRRLLHQGRYQAAAGRRSIIAALAEGCTLVIGERNAADRARFYRKTYDTHAGESYAPLPTDQHTARMERTLTGPACPIATLADWRSFRFETLAERFAMVLPAQDATPLTVTIRTAYGPALGRPDDPKKRTSHRRQSATAAMRDTALNAKIRQALRDLTERTRRAEGAGIRGISKP